MPALTGLIWLATAQAQTHDSGHDAFQRLRAYHSCGDCLAVGGAWCLQGSRCVPDGRGLCGAGSGPNDHVGWAGHGRCPDHEDFQLQVYLQAPRRPPAGTEPGAAPPPSVSECTATCSGRAYIASVSDGSTSGRDDPADTLRSCGMVVLSDMFNEKALRELRKKLIARKDLSGPEPRLGNKLELPGVRGSLRQEMVLPYQYSPPLLDGLRDTQAFSILRKMLGHVPAIDFVSVVGAWPGATAQPMHRDVEPGTEAALLLFVPLDETSAPESDEGDDVNDLFPAGPPELCPCTHFPGAPEECSEAPFPMSTQSHAAIPIGSAIIYDPGLVHRGLSYHAAANHTAAAAQPTAPDPLMEQEQAGGSADGQARLMLSIALSPGGAGIRARPEVFLGDAAATHLRRWRESVLEGDSDATRCELFKTCRSCLDAVPRGAGAEFGCGWCSDAQACVPDVTAACATSSEHRGESGLAGDFCPDDDKEL